MDLKNKSYKKIMLKTKKELFINLLEKNINILQCPICKNEVSLTNGSVKCNNNHSFDISRKGVLLLHKKYKKCQDEIYTKQLFTNRRNFILKGFYNDVYNVIDKIISNKYQNKKIKLLDLGSGECSHIKQIMKENFNVFAVDLSYNAIELASDYIKDNILPICADVYNLPFKNKSFDCIIDFLSPFNSIETKRVLKDNGILIKIIPTKEYLKELRNILCFKDYEKEEDIINNISKSFNILDKTNVSKCFELDEQTKKELINMTPLSNHLNISPIIYKKLNKITINLDILCCFNKSNQNFD